jgi:outer membrane murein-binding lipoprotein Lpp
MTTTSDERRVWVALAETTLKTCYSENRRDLATAVVRLVEEVGQLQEQLNNTAERAKHIYLIKQQLAQANQRIEALENAIRYELTQVVYKGYNEPARRNVSSTYARLSDALAADDKEATK